MDNDQSRYGLRAILQTGNLFRLSAIGVVAAASVGVYAYLGGWLTPAALTQDAMINRFQAVNGTHPGFRRNHAKGVCITGYFEPNGAGESLSKASVFQPGRIPVEGRFALAVGAPNIPDSGKLVRSMALRFQPADGQEWRTGMNDIPVFPVRDAQAFYDQLLAAKPDPATGKPDPAKMSTFLAAHPETAKAFALITSRPFSSGFDDAQYNGLNAFRFIAADGKSTPVRWSMVPQQPVEPEPANAPATPDYLFDTLATKIASAPLRWNLLITIGEAGDVTSDATIAWPADRKSVDVGTLTIDAIKAEEQGNCRDINFDPLVLPDGIEPSDDPLLSARSAAYSVSFRRRAGEDHTPSEVQPADIAGGK